MLKTITDPRSTRQEPPSEPCSYDVFEFKRKNKFGALSCFNVYKKNIKKKHHFEKKKTVFIFPFLFIVNERRCTAF